MSDGGGTSAQYIEVPVTKTCKSSLNVRGMLLVGGLGYVLWKTFLLEERVNDLTVLLKRQSHAGTQPIAYNVEHDAPRRQTHTEEEYETSEDGTDDEDGPDDAPGPESEDDDERIEEQPQEVPPQTVPESVSAPPESMFVTTRQRRTGSELRRTDRFATRT